MTSVAKNIAVDIIARTGTLIFFIIVLVNIKCSLCELKYVTPSYYTVEDYQHFQLTMVYDKGVKIRNRDDIWSDDQRQVFLYQHLGIKQVVDKYYIYDCRYLS